MKLTPSHQSSVRVYAEDVDYMGIVYHANYLRYFERARTEMLRSKGLLLSKLMNENVLFAISELNIKHLFPAKLDNLLTISTRIGEQNKCSFVFNQMMHNENNNLICEANIKVVCVDGHLKPRRLPELFAAANE
ncbi:YbgC/FadM family acyl-CoA thioesterase [Legionella bononiensis]|uniref:YbgC/FadM family acyl-CoA thioesterase n=1 Tax=Legionella bononiensis TaxID=2793102 RepID=UPI001931D018|nr:YbgC/FadM family acyl-CoA thioesterase [Legionella bononiensis]MBL7478828.1 YbgC/FadM family acyl-CoA thioesterase [Legionella bononiensis]MBL7562448.1 YbgC/FadM family acyl-CoA thioesterase [Legionella bononiensis]